MKFCNVMFYHISLFPNSFSTTFSTTYSATYFTTSFANSFTTPLPTSLQQSSNDERQSVITHMTSSQQYHFNHYPLPYGRTSTLPSTINLSGQVTNKKIDRGRGFYPPNPDSPLKTDGSFMGTGTGFGTGRGR